MSMANFVVASVSGGLIGLAGSMAYVMPELRDLEEQLALRPPVLVVDRAKLALDAVPPGSGDAAMDQHFRNQHVVIDKFRDAGFLVLSREHLIAAPLDLMLRPEDLTVNPRLGGDRTHDSE
ncbi:MAG: hypothetical protein KA756_10690 [Steroidobacteraceae bacterium]|nr:hypothetical protein [Steroidobacteraceae bacterium]